MKPIDYRNTTFAELRGQLVKKREAVWLDWQAYEIELQAAGAALGATTREVCQRFGRDILQFRPRCTELYQLGVLTLVEQDSQNTAPASSPGGEDTGEGGPLTPVRSRKSEIVNRKSREGIYRLRSVPEWEAWHTAQREGLVSTQQQLL